MCVCVCVEKRGSGSVFSLCYFIFISLSLSIDGFFFRHIIDALFRCSERFADLVLCRLALAALETPMVLFFFSFSLYLFFFLPLRLLLLLLLLRFGCRWAPGAPMADGAGLGKTGR